MALKFIGRINSQGRQTFRSGVLRVKGPEKMETYQADEPEQDEEGNPVTYKSGPKKGQNKTKKVDHKRKVQAQWTLKTKDIGETIDAGDDEGHLLEKYPLLFEKS